MTQSSGGPRPLQELPEAWQETGTGPASHSLAPKTGVANAGGARPAPACWSTRGTRSHPLTLSLLPPAPAPQ